MYTKSLPHNAFHFMLTLEFRLIPQTRILGKVPLQFRFGFNGLLSNILLVVVYNWAVENFSTIAPSTVYSVVYLIFIPLGHAMASLLVFGWPERYFPSLVSNFPIGLTGLALGGILTAYMDQVHFNERVTSYIRDNYTFSRMPAQDEGEFYSSLAVLVATSIWTYVLSVYINSLPTKSEKKEL
jgi:hypothetical protein